MDNTLTLEWIKFGVSIVAGILAAIWAFFKWDNELAKERKSREDQIKKEETERRKRIAALYVNPFLMACESLQSRIYNILEKNGLVALRKRYPDGSYAEDTLYLIAQYFAWERCLYRYTPYAQNQNVIQLTQEIRQFFATDRWGVGPFCLYRSDQRDLG